MIDWYFLFTNALWVLGLSLVLSSFGWAVYEKTENHFQISAFYRRATPAWIIRIGGLLFCTGFALTINRIWEQVLWIVLDVTFFVDTILLIRKKL